MKKIILLLALFCGLAISGFAQSATELRGALRPERTCFDALYYHLHLKIDVSKKWIGGYNEIHFKVLEPTKKIQLDLFKNMDIDSMVYEKKHLVFERKHDAVWVFFESDLPLNSIQKIQVFYNGKPRTNQGTHKDHGFHWQKDAQDRDWIGVNCEHTGASLWYPNKDHLSDEPDSVRLSITAPKELTCIANGKLENTVDAEDGYKTWHWFTKYRINNYNVTFYLGHFTKHIVPYQNYTGKHEIEFYVLDYRSEEQVLQYTQYIPATLLYFESLFGEYPFWDEKMAIVEGGYRGMEHQTCLNIGTIKKRGNWLYNTPWSSTLVHEIAHEWWGNAVSVKDMADAWLHEGFATYCEALVVEKAFGKEAYLLFMKRVEFEVRATRDIVGDSDVNYNSFQDNHIYFGGAMVLHQLRTKMNNDRVFFGILTGFQAKYKFQTVTTDDFINTVNQMSGKDYTQFLKKLLY